MSLLLTGRRWLRTSRRWESRLLAWMRRPPSVKYTALDVGVVKSDASREPGSSPLHKYLDDRFADAVVLTFAEIEDLIGEALPEGARQNAEWWTTPEPTPSGCGLADSWILAHRTARPNLRALTVAFDRAN